MAGQFLEDILAEDDVRVDDLLEDLLLFISPALSLVLRSHGVRTFASEISRVQVGTFLWLLLFEEVQGKLGAELPNLVDEVFERLHPKLIDGGNEFYPWSFEPLGVGEQIVKPCLKLSPEA